MPVNRSLDAFRLAPWLDGSRTRAWLNILLAITGSATLAYLVLVGSGAVLTTHRIGEDFASFWTASQIALNGAPVSAWDMAVHEAAQRALHGPEVGYAAFFYPPTYLLLCLPLALVPYLMSLILWLGATFWAWARMMRAWMRTEFDWLIVIGFPAVMINALHGQNGFLTAALFGGATLVAQRRPWLCGVLFGSLIFKPHLAVLVPIFLILTGNWRAFLTAGMTAVGLCLVSLLVFGPEAWQAFIANSTTARAALEDGLVGFGKMQSSFAGVRLIGGSISLAWVVQGATALIAVAGLWAVLRKRSSGPDDPSLAPGGGTAEGAALACATLLTTPFLLDYDLTLLAIPLAWLFVQARREGFLPWERLLLVFVFVLPLLTRPLAMELGVPATPVVIAALLLCVMRRAGVRLPMPFYVPFSLARPS